MRVGLCLYYFFSMTWAINIRYSKFKYQLEDDGAVCKLSGRLLSIHDQSLISCGVVCKTEPECKSFHFNELNTTCILCGDLDVSGSTEEEDTNIAHYILVQEQNVSSEVKNVVTTTEMSSLSSETALVLLSTSTDLSVLSTPRSTNWIRYGNHLYAYVPMKKKWSEAEKICRAYGNHSYLVSLTTKGEAQFIHDTFVGDNDAGTKSWSWVASISKSSGDFMESQQLYEGQVGCISVYRLQVTFGPCNRALPFTCQKTATPGA